MSQKYQGSDTWTGDSPINHLYSALSHPSSERQPPSQAKLLRDQFLMDINPNSARISAYYDDIISRLEQAKQQKLLELSESAQKGLTEKQVGIYQGLKKAGPGSELPDILLQDIHSCLSPNVTAENKPRYILNQRDTNKIFEIIESAEQGLCKHSKIYSQEKPPVPQQLQKQYTMMAFDNCVQSFKTKDGEYKRLSETLQLSEILQIQFLEITLQLAKIIVKQCQKIHKITAHSIISARNIGITYKNQEHQYLYAQVFQEFKKLPKLREVDLTSPPEYPQVQMDFFVSLPLVRELSLSGNMKSGKTLVDILMKKRNYEKVSLLGPQTVEARLSKQCLGFMLRALPNLKCLIIQQQQFKDEELEVIGKFHQLQQLRLSDQNQSSGMKRTSYRNITALYTPFSGQKVDKPNINVLLNQFPKMRTFIFNLAPIGVNEMKRILDVLPGLEVLDIKTVKNAPIQFFQFLAQLRNLRRLTIKSESISDESIYALSQTKFRLTALSIDFTAAVPVQPIIDYTLGIGVPGIRGPPAIMHQLMYNNVPEDFEPIINAPPAYEYQQQYQQIYEVQPLPVLSFSPLLRPQTNLTQITIHSPLTDKNCQDLSHLPHLQTLNVILNAMPSNNYAHNLLNITNAGFCYLSKLRKVKLINLLQLLVFSLHHNNQYLRFAKNNWQFKPDLRIMYLNQREIRNSILMFNLDYSLLALQTRVQPVYDSRNYRGLQRVPNIYD